MTGDRRRRVVYEGEGVRLVQYPDGGVVDGYREGGRRWHLRNPATGDTVRVEMMVDDDDLTRSEVERITEAGLMLEREGDTASRVYVPGDRLEEAVVDGEAVRRGRIVACVSYLGRLTDSQWAAVPGTPPGTPMVQQ